ncbi:hypothetical protein BH11MYX2_BH11MYX2_17800 [soil metagenome]
MRRPLHGFFLGLLTIVALAACGDDGNNNDHPDAGPGHDAGPDVEEVTCAEIPASTNVCDVSGTGDAKLIKGEVLTPTKLFHGGEVAVDNQGSITCVGCNCEEAGQTVISCPGASISPGLINTHDHITFTQNQPYNDGGARYDDRQQWRKGLDSKPKISSAGGASADAIRWGELRFLMGGATSIVGSGGQPGILRNLDSNDQEGLNQKAVDFDTFPLDDSGATRRTGDCNYGGDARTASSIASVDSFEPHTSEGVDATAHNEFLCQSSMTFDTMAPGVSNTLVVAKTAMIHAVGLQPADLGAMAAAGTAIIWSPRSNITLYGDTARVAEAARMGVEIALGTDWMPTGSMNLLRELSCADSFNKSYLDNYFSDRQLWQMVTASAASVTATDDVIGVLAPGKIADISIFAAHGKPAYRAVIEAEPKDVALVLRGGKALYGDKNAITMLATDCDDVDVCTVGKQVCLMGEVGKHYEALKTAAGATIYPAFACGVPMNEPTCTPKRPTATAGSTIFTGVSSADDSDGDGIKDTDDNCPHTFNPVRPMDDGMQPDADSDGDGDACDPCPLDADSTSCSTIDPNDRDHDGAANDTDNCPDVANADQLDTDHDMKGDVCDACPAMSNEGGAGCSVSIYKVKDGSTPVGTAVRITNALVTGKGANGFFVQVKMGDSDYVSADNSGLFVFANTGSTLLANAVVGKRGTVNGAVAVFQGQTELDTVTAVTPGAGAVEALPTPVMATYDEVKTGGTRALKLESVLVSLPGATVTAANAMFGELTLTAGATTLTADDFLYVPMPAITVGQSYTGVTGILTLRQMASKIEPRSQADFVGGAPGLTSFGPTGTFARVGVTTNLPTFPTPLTVTLSGPAAMATTVTITSSAGLTVANVVVQMGATSAPVPVTANTAGDATLMATLGVQVQMTTVHVPGATEAPDAVTLTPADTAVAPAGTVTLTATLNKPALTATTVTLAVTAGNGTLSTNMVTINPNETSTTFTFTETVGSGFATVTATFGGSTAQAKITTSTGAQHLVINEIDYDNVGTDTAEFVEIYNPSASPISLANKQLLLVNGSGNMVYSTIDLGTGTLAAGAYLVIAGANVSVTAANATKLDPGWTQDKIQNGAPDGVALVDNTTHTLIDALSYEGSITADLPGIPGAMLVEGVVLPLAVADSNTAEGSLCRSPNGQDTNSASVDWKICATLSAGAPNP